MSENALGARLPRGAWAALAAIATLLGGGVVAVVSDFDADGLSTVSEWRQGSDPWDGDVDRDGLRDGDEIRAGTQWDNGDSDGDGILDGDEIRVGMDPLSQDTDGDSIPDGQEPLTDCNGDGIPAFATSDDDGDGLPDLLEPLQACDPDVDRDGILDGFEGNRACIVRTDCDGDGLRDAFEIEQDYSPLDPDTFDSGLSDAVTYAFELAGQPPSADQDGDGIPDGWEDNPDFVWGPFQPSRGRTDVLVEFLRVSGPDSGDYDLNFTPAYEAVAAMFEAQGLHMVWIETPVPLAEEARPDFLTPQDFDFYRTLLDRSVGASNPYVTSVVLNPQQVQQDLGSILGAAFLRSMIATVDYGAHTVFTFEAESGATLQLRPIVESHIQSGNPELIEAYGFDSGGINEAGEVFLRDAYDASIDTGYTVTWRPEWFQTAPRYAADNDLEVQTNFVSVRLETATLASTIAHELGHTLGLCHTHERVCNAQYGSLSDAQIRSTTMSYTAQEDALHFLNPEWQRLEQYLGCAPQQTVALLAINASYEDRVDAKYGPSFTTSQSSRTCLDRAALQPSLVPVDATTVPFTPADLAGVRSDADVWLVRYAFAVAVLAGIAAAVTWIRWPAPPKE